MLVMAKGDENDEGLEGTRKERRAIKARRKRKG